MHGKKLYEYLIDLFYSDKFLARCIDPLFPCSHAHQHDLQVFIITVGAWLSLSMVCCFSDTPLCDKGNVTVIHQPICFFGGSQFLFSFLWFIFFLPCPLLPLPQRHKSSCRVGTDASGQTKYTRKLFYHLMKQSSCLFDQFCFKV